MQSQEKGRNGYWQEKMNFVLAHGFNVSDGGAGSIDRLLPFLPGTIQQADYGWTFRARVRLCNKNIAKTIAGMALPRSIGIGHSNGCALLLLAAKYGAPIRHLIFINPALDNDIDIPLQVDRVDVYHTDEDDAVKWAKYIPFSIWGDMGREGYKGEDSRVFNHSGTKLFGATGHSDIFNYADRLAVHFLENVSD